MTALSRFAAGLADRDALRQAVAGCDAVIHLAALVSVPLSINEPLRTFELNTLGSARVLDAAREAGCMRVVLASTASVYGDLPGIKTEGSPVAPIVPYATSKLLAEGICQSYAQNYAMSCVQLRYFNVYGVRQLAGSPYSGARSFWNNSASP